MAAHMKGIGVHTICLLLGAVTAVLCGAAPASADTLASTQSPGTESASTQPTNSSYGITGNWFGARDELSNDGLTFTGSIDYDYSKNFQGGISTADYASRELTNLNFTLTSDQKLGWIGGTFFINLQDHEGTDGSKKLVGDIQGFDNQDGPRAVQFAQLWFQQVFADNTLRLKVGRVDANTEFAYVTAGSAFLNSSFGYSAAIFAFPTYPDPAPSINLFWTPDPHFTIGAGIYDSNRDQRALILNGDPYIVDPSSGGVFSIVEADYKWTVGSSQLPGRAGFGAYYHNGQFNQFGSGTQNGAGGVYALAEQQVWQSSSESSENIAIFIQGATADPHVSNINNQIGGGFAWTGPIPTRPTDIFGVAASNAGLSGDAGFSANYELAIEGFYRVLLTPWLFIQPDLQYIINPGGIHPDALVGTVRVELDF
jgi:porin